MKIDSVYLGQMVPFDGKAEELAELLTEIGIEVETLSGEDRTVLEFEITPNRPDWLSHYGVAREVAAKSDRFSFTPFQTPEIETVASRIPFRVVIEDPADCSRYTGCIVAGVTVKPSSPWLRQLVERLGMRSINNIVDISNLVMLTCGHPIHIFDLAKLEGNEIRIRRGRDGERLVLLDEKELSIGGENLVIADGRKPLALAGIMGGLDSGVSQSTRDVFIESAHFHPPVIRRTCRAMGLKTDASYRFERGMDVENTIMGVRLALKWLAEDQGKSPEIAFFQDEYPKPFQPKVVDLAKPFPASFTGIDVPERTCAEVLRKLGFGCEDREDHWQVTVPSFRVDVSGKEDLVEEIIRIYGYKRLASELPPHAGIAVSPNAGRNLEKNVSWHLVSAGFFEAINYVFQSPEDNLPFLAEPSHIMLKNPLGRDFSAMKASLLPGLLRNCTYNFNQGQKRVMLFELGKVFFREESAAEKRNLALAVAGEHMRMDWRTPGSPFDIWLFRSLLASLFDRMRWTGSWEASSHEFFDPACCFSFSAGAGGRSAGLAGMVKAEVSERFGCPETVFAAEFDLSVLAASGRKRAFCMWNRFPAATRDFSFLMDRQVPFAELAAAIRAQQPEELESFLLPDVYEGENLPPGKIGLSLSFTYRGEDRTLTAEETNEIHRRMITGLIERLALIQR